MAKIFYTIFLFTYRASIFIASIWNEKAKHWLSGRKNIFVHLQKAFADVDSKVIWFHSASLGEFEQGRPVLEKLKNQYPDSKILLTFFSPSGYNIRKDYKKADWVFYMPLDSGSNAKRFLDIVNPSLVVFVKYDYWYHYLSVCKEKKIPLLMISSVFRKNQSFFKWYGKFHRRMLNSFTHFFVQDEVSKILLQLLNINNVTVAGDTRFDRVSEVADEFQPIDAITDFCANSKVLVAGSTWPKDEKILEEALLNFPDLKLIIAPHEINQEHLIYIKKLFPDSVLFSDLKSDKSKFLNRKILIIDNIGMLSKLYYYATCCYVGGGFGHGIHNILEAAVYGKPVFFGPRFEKFQEAYELKKAGAGFDIKNKEELVKLISIILNDRESYITSCKNAKAFVQNNKGATEKIVHYIQENRLLTKL